MRKVRIGRLRKGGLISLRRLKEMRKKEDIGLGTSDF